MESTRADSWTVTEYRTDARIWHTGVGGSAVLNGIDSKYYIGRAFSSRLWDLVWPGTLFIQPGCAGQMPAPEAD